MKKIFQTIFLFLFTVKLFSQPSNYLFHTLGEQNGLSYNYCMAMLKDSRGQMWVGTWKGLNRFDGYQFYQFNARQDSNSFINNTIIDLCEDKKGNIWGATGSGIFCYDAAGNKFINYTTPGYEYAWQVHNIVCDKKGDIWASGLWTILKLNKQQNKFEEIGPLTANKDSLSHYAVMQNGMVADPAGNGIWMATAMGLHFYNAVENKFYSYKNKPGDPLFALRNVSALSLSAFGSIWFCDNDAKKIIAFNPSSHKVLHTVDVKNISPGTGHILMEDSHHRLWFSAFGSKTVVINYSDGSFSALQYKTDNPLSFPSDIFHDIWEDEDNTVWLCTSAGLSKCNYSKSSYSIYPLCDTVKEFPYGSLGSITVDPRDESWWVASEGNLSLIHYYPETGRYIYFDFNKAVANSRGKKPSYVFGVSFINNRPYVSTHTGVWLLDENTRQVLPFEKSFKGLPSLNTYAVHPAGDIFWFVTRTGFVKWNSITDEAKFIKASSDVLPDGQKIRYEGVAVNDSGQVYFFPAFGWMGWVNEKDEIELNYYVKDKPKEQSSYITSIAFDKKGYLWMSSISAGIYRYNLKNRDIELLDKIPGITTSPGTIVFDKQERMWLANRNKISVYNPGNGSVSSFSLPLYLNLFSYHSFIQAAPSGEILVTLHKDIIRVFPERLNAKPVVKQVLLSMVKVSGKIRLINNEKILQLEPEENSVEFTFGSLINKEVFPYTFEYRLDGFDDKWNEEELTMKALYSNLRPGKYVFRVKAVDKSKSWETPERTITIIIRTPFYQSNWFWALIAGLLLSVLFFFYRFRLYKQRQILTLETKAQLLEKEKTHVMYENLKQHLNPHFLFNSLTSLSSLIRIDQKQAGNFLEKMSKVYRYILKNRDNETVPLADEVKFVQLYNDLQKTRFEGGLMINMNIDEEYYDRKIAPVTLQNLVENAIKHNTADATSPLVIDLFVEDDYLVVKNNLQKKGFVETSNKQGLGNMQSLYRFLSERRMSVEESETEFIVKVPLI